MRRCVFVKLNPGTLVSRLTAQWPESESAKRRIGLVVVTHAGRIVETNLMTGQLAAIGAALSWTLASGLWRSVSGLDQP